MQAMKWLRGRLVEGHEGLRAEYSGNDKKLFKDTSGDGVLRIEEVIRQVAEELQKNNTDPKIVEESEKVFEKGFKPLEDAFKWKGHNYHVFDQWTEILPTDQVVAVKYDPEDHLL